MRISILFFVLNLFTYFFCKAQVSIPNNFRVTTSECGKIQLEWDAVQKPSNASFLGYIIEKSQDNSYWYGFNSEIITENINSDTTTMEAGRTYYYRIKTRIDFAESPFSEAIFTNMNCGTIQNLIVNSSDCGNINLTWTPLINENNLRGHIIYLHKPNENSKLLSLGEVGANVNSFAVKGFAYSQNNISINSIANLNYEFVVKAKIFRTTTEISNIVNAQFICPPTPSPRVISSDCMNIKIAWDDFASPFEESGFQIFRASDKNGRYRLINEVGPNVLEFEQKEIYTGEGGINEISVGSDRNYFYKICGKFNNNRSQFSDSVLVNVNCNAPNGLRVIETTCNTAKLTWYTLPVNSGVVSYGILGSENYIDGDYEFVGSVNSNLTEYVFNKWDHQPRYKFFKVYANYQNAYSSVGSTPSFSNYNCIENGLLNTQLFVNKNNCAGFELIWFNPSEINPPFKQEIIRTWADENNIIQYEIQELISLFGSGATTFSENRKLINRKEYKYSLKVTKNGNVFYSDTLSVIYNCNAEISLVVNNGINCLPMTAQWSINNEVLTNIQLLYSINPNGAFTYLNSIVNENSISDINKLGIFLPNQNYYFMISGSIGQRRINSNLVTGNFSCSSNLTLNASSNCNQFMLNWTDNEPNVPNNGFLLTNESLNLPSYYILPKDSYSYTFDAPTNKIKFKISKIIGTVNSDFSNEIEQEVQNCYNKPILTLAQMDCHFIKFNIDLNNNLEGKNYAIHIFRFTDPNKLNLIGYNLKQNYFFDITTGQYNFPTEVNKNYNYKLVLVIGSLRFESDLVVGSFNCPLNNPVTNLSASSDCNTIKLNWDSAPNPNNIERIFYIFKSENGINGDYKSIGGIYPPTSFIDQSPFEANKVYYYKIGYIENQLMQTLSMPTSIILQPNMASIKSGNWHDPTVWSCFRIPKRGDEILINQGHEINVINSNAETKNITLKGILNVSSTLKFEN